MWEQEEFPFVARTRMGATKPMGDVFGRLMFDGRSVGNSRSNVAVFQTLRPLLGRKCCSGRCTWPLSGRAFSLSMICGNRLCSSDGTADLCGEEGRGAITISLATYRRHELDKLLVTSLRSHHQGSLITSRVLFQSPPSASVPCLFSCSSLTLTPSDLRAAHTARPCRPILGNTPLPRLRVSDPRTIRCHWTLTVAGLEWPLKTAQC